MSRSHKHSPFTGHTTAETEKNDKRIANRRERRNVRQLIAAGVDDCDLPDRRAISSPWQFDKDGKQRIGPDTPDYERLMRK